MQLNTSDVSRLPPEAALDRIGSERPTDNLAKKLPGQPDLRHQCADVVSPKH